MDGSYLQLGAIALTMAWVIGALLALSGERQPGAWLNALVSAAIGGTTLPSIGAALADRQQYVHLYGAAAMQQLPLAISVLSLSLVGVCLSLAALGRSHAPFVIGWFVNAPVVAALLYLAFWFRPY
jgi:hypothetical protein